MKMGHVTGEKMEKAGSQDWYNEYAEQWLAQIEQGWQAPTVAQAEQPAAQAEPLCGITVEFEIAGQKAWAKGQGQTPDEATTNMQATMARAIIALETPQPAQGPNYYEKLGRLITCGYEKAKGDAKLTERFSKAIQLVVGGHVSQGMTSDQIFYVGSQQADTTTQYYVNGQTYTCTCADAQRHQDETGYLCKHALAVKLTQKLAHSSK